MRSSSAMLSDESCQHRRARHSRRCASSMATIGGDSGFCWRGQVEGQDLVVDDGRDRLHLGQHLEARLRLARLGRLGAEAVDEGSADACAALPASSCALAGSACCFGALAFEARIIAAPERSLPLSRCRMWSADGVEQIAVMADDEDRRRIARADNRSARACLRDRDNWSARRAAEGRAAKTAPRRARRASASRRKIPTARGFAPRRRSRGRRGFRRRARARRGRRCRRAASGFRRCDAGRSRVSASRISAARSTSASSTKSIRLCRAARRLLLDAAERASARRLEMAPPRARISPAIMRNSVVLPAPLRPTKPMRARSGSSDARRSNRRRGPSR